MSDRPTFDDIRGEQVSFIAHPKPALGPKMARALTEIDEVYADTLVTLLIIRTALGVGQHIDPEHLPEKIVRIIEANCVRSSMPLVDGGYIIRASQVRGR